MPHLTAHMRAALERALREDGLRRVHDDQPGKPPWPAPAATLHALERHDLLTKSERRSRKGFPMTVWTITDQGRQALERPQRIYKDTVRRIPGRTTTLHPLPGGGWEEIRMPEPEVVDPQPLAGAHGRWERDRLATERARYAGMTIGERLDAFIAEAKERRLDPSNLVRLVDRKLTEAERRKDRAA